MLQKLNLTNPRLIKNQINWLKNTAKRFSKELLIKLMLFRFCLILEHCMQKRCVKNSLKLNYKHKKIAN